MMHIFLLVAVGLMVATWLFGLVIRRWSHKYGTLLALIANLVGRLAVTAVFAQIAAQAAGKSGAWLALAALFAALALLSLFFAGAILWAVATRTWPERA
jgi:hypothetical protein